MNLESKLVRGASLFEEKTGAVSTPIYQTATFRHPRLHESTGYDYSRLQNPTREELEKTIASLESGFQGFAFSSGMAAITTTLALFSKGEHIIVSDDLYGGTYRVFEDFFKNYGIEFTYTDTSIQSEVEKAIRSNTKGFFIETPTNPMMKVTDIRKCVSYAKSIGALTIVDNTFLTPYYQRPIELGADIVIHSGTKYLGGHNDTLAGLVVVGKEILAERIGFVQKSIGAVLSPFDSWLILRGIKTLSVRLDRQQENALAIAKWLEKHDKIEKVYYVGLPNHDGYQISLGQSSGFSAMISFSVKDRSIAEKVLERVNLILFAESLGGVESLITYPLVQTHEAIPEEIRNRLGIDEKLLRLSVGLEHVNDILGDLEQALK